ncbi:hypothetical protein AAE478_003806 [Parahypoxylon ruwenzoriense]
MEDNHTSDYEADLDAGALEMTHRVRSSYDQPHTSPGNGSTDSPKRRISEWAESSARNDDDYAEGEEHEHLLDPNLPDQETIELHRMGSGSLDFFDDEAAAKASEENSPYEEVRAAVRNYDEDLPCNTIRAWTIGLTLVLVGASTNTLFSLRQPSIGLGALIAQIIAWPLGRAWEKVVPDRQISMLGLRCDLNPGPFNIKEHSIIVVMASVSFSVAYATDIILAQLVFYKQNFGIIFQLVLTISTQSLGYGIAGMMRKFLVYPASMIWPGNLVAVALMSAMYEEPQAPDPSIIGGRMPRYRWFGLITLASGLYYFIPGYFAQCLSIFAFATWMAPQNPVVNQLFGGTTGLSLLPITFDWTQIAGFIGSPLIPPWNSTNEKPDIHMKLMQKYKEAPSWWYFSLFAIVLALAFLSVLAYPTNLTWWAFLLAVGISFMFSLPIGIIQAVTNHQIGLNVLTEFVYGYIQPGRPLALMLFKTYGYITMSQALSFVSDLKFGHYMKIPPRTMFMAQVVATTFSCFIQIAVLNFALNNIDGICDLTQPQRFTCPGGRVFFSASVIWGLIGPARVFSPGQIYSGLLIFFVIGAITPVVFWFAARRWPRSPARYLMAPLVFGGAGNIPPATPLNYLSWGFVGYVFQHLVKKRHFRWWTRLNYLTSAGLDLGLALATLFIFFAFTLNDVQPPSWWPNAVVSTTMDYRGEAVQAVLPPGETFGPKTW